MLDVYEEVKNLYKSDCVHKNLVIHFPNGEREDIGNDNIVSESLRFTESLCSQNDLKLGLCEASVIEFETVGIENIKGKTFEASIGIDIGNGIDEKTHTNEELVRNPDHACPDGKFEYLYGRDQSVVTLRSSFQCTYSIILYKDTFYSGASFFIYLTDADTGQRLDLIHINYPDYIDSGTQFRASQPVSLETAKKIISAKNITYNLSDEFVDPFGRVSKAHFVITGFSMKGNYKDIIKPDNGYQIPLGTFYVDSCKRQADTNRRKVVGYTLEPAWGKTVSDFEAFKQNVLVRNYDYFKIDVYNYLLENNVIPEGLLYPATYTEMSLTNAYDKTFYMQIHGSDGSDYYLQVDYLYKRLTFANTDTLYKVTNKCPLEPNSASTSGYPLDAYIFSAMREWYGIDFIFYSGTTNLGFLGGALESDSWNVSFSSLGYRGSANYSTTEVFSNWGEEEKIINPYIYRTDGASNPVLNVLAGFRIIVRYDTTGTILHQKDIIINDVKVEKIVDSHIKTESKFMRDYVRREIDDVSVTGYNITSDAISLREISEAYIEFHGLMGKYNRYNTFELINVSKSFALYPKETLYPDESLYPSDPTGGYITPALYTSAEYDDEERKPYGRVCVTFNRLESGETDPVETWAYYDLVDDYSSGDYELYSVTDNYLITNSTFTMAQITQILQNIAENIKDVVYMQSNVNCVGLPYIETGDTFEVITRRDGFQTLVFRRTMSGLQRLTDNFVTE